jgi:poly(3-hydroxybutyrate) depolymerase
MTKPPARRPKKEVRKLQHQGRERVALIRHALKPRFAVLLLHPYASSGSAMASTGGWLEREDVTVIAPDGCLWRPEERASIENARIWSSGEPEIGTRDVDDVEFLDSLLDQVLQELPTNTPMVVVGHSMGGAMAFRMLCESRHREKLAAGVVYAGMWSCEKRVLDQPILYLAGTHDRIRPFAGNQEVVVPWVRLWTTPLMNVVRACVEATGARRFPDIAIDDAALTMRWSGGRADVELQVLQGQGHHWPTGKPMAAEWEPLMGPNNLSINATERACDFVDRVLGLAPRS